MLNRRSEETHQNSVSIVVLYNILVISATILKHPASPELPTQDLTLTPTQASARLTL